MTKIEYQEALKDPRWKAKSEKIKARDGYKCTQCDSKKCLNVHHLKYRGLPWEVPDEWLTTLCKSCHDKIHHQVIEIMIKAKIKIKKKLRPKQRHKINVRLKEIKRLKSKIRLKQGLISKIKRKLTIFENWRNRNQYDQQLIIDSENKIIKWKELLEILQKKDNIK